MNIPDESNKHDGKADKIHNVWDSDSTFHLCFGLGDSLMLPDVIRNDDLKPLNNSPEVSSNVDAEQRIVDVFVWLLTNEGDRNPVDSGD